MSLPARRTLSWLATLAVFAGVVGTLRRLPGWSGYYDELRWLMCESFAPHTANRVRTLLVLGSGSRAAAAVQTLGRLLAERDPQIVDNALGMLPEYLFGFTGPEFHDPDSAIRAFRDWFESLDSAARMRHASGIVVFLGNINLLTRTIADPRGARPVTLTPADDPWLLHATVDPKKYAGSLARVILFDSENAETREELFKRYLAFEGFDRLTGQPRNDQPVVDWLPMQLTIHPRLTAALSDSHPTVRHAAARILAVCRDERALPVIHDWLKNDPKAPQSAHRVLAELFGPDWRKPFEAEPAPAPPAP